MNTGSTDVHRRDLLRLAAAGTALSATGLALGRDRSRQHELKKCLKFGMVKTDGSVHTWGHADFGGNSAAVSGSLMSNVHSICSTDQACDHPRSHKKENREIYENI